MEGVGRQGLQEVTKHEDRVLIRPQKVPYPRHHVRAQKKEATHGAESGLHHLLHLFWISNL